MARNERQPTAQTSALIDRAANVLERVEAAYRSGNREETLLAGFRAQLEPFVKSDDRGELIGFFMLPIISGEFGSDLLGFVFDPDGFNVTKYTSLAEDMAAIVKATGLQPRGFNRVEGRRLLDTLDEKTPIPPKGGSLIAFARFAQSQKLGHQLRQWVEKEGWWTDRSVDRKATDDKVAEELARRTGGQPAPDPRAELERQITEKETTIKASVAKGTSESYTEAGKLSGELKQLQKQLEEINAQPVVANPTPAPAATSETQVTAQPTPTGKTPRKGLTRKATAEAAAPTLTPTPEAVPMSVPVPVPAPTAIAEATPVVTVPISPNGGVMTKDQFVAEVKALGIERSELMTLIIRYADDPSGAIETLQTLKSL